MIYSNPPLRIGQTLTPRPNSNFPHCKITDYNLKADGIIWTVVSADDTQTWYMPISQVYAAFKFDNGPLDV